MSGGSAGSRVVNGLRESLRTGTISPGMVLSQADMAAECRVSRISVRDALRVLASPGVIRGVSSAIVAGQSIPALKELCEMRDMRDMREAI